MRSFFTLADGSSKKYSEEIEPHYPIGDKGQVIKDEFVACDGWLLSMNCVDIQDYEILKKLRNYRNSIAHDLAELLTDFKGNVVEENVAEALRILTKLSVGGQ